MRMKHVLWEIKRMRTKVKILPLSNEYLKEAKQAFCEAITIAIGEHFEFLLQMGFKITYLKRRLTGRAMGSTRACSGGLRLRRELGGAGGTCLATGTQGTGRAAAKG